MGFAFTSYNGVEPVSIDYVIERLGINKLHEVGITGKGVRIGVIDTGVDDSHEWLRGRVKFKYSLVDNGDTMDYYGHGTHVAGIISRIAPVSYIYSVKVFGKNNDTDVLTIVRALSILYSKGVDIINMSLGANINCCISIISTIIRANNRVVHVASIGNNDGETGTCECPAMIEDVIAVGSLDPVTLKIARFSSRGPGCFMHKKPLVVAPGGSYKHCIVSSYPGNTYGCLSGTSQATPIVSGLSALIIEYARSIGAIRVNVDNALMLLGNRGKQDNTYGYGVPLIKSFEQFRNAVIYSSIAPKRIAESVISTLMFSRLIVSIINNI